MKKIICITVLLITAAGLGSAQSLREITAIRLEVNLINKNARKYQKKTRNVDDVSLEGAEATYFLSGRGLKKITAKMYGETYRATAELYYSGEEMIFAYQRLEQYNTHIAMKPPPKVVKVIETRVYYSGGKAIRVIEEGKTLATSDSAFTGAVEGMDDLSQKLKAAIQ